MILVNPAQANWLEDQKQKNDRKDAKNLAQFLRLGDVPESYASPEKYRRYRAQARGRKKLVDKRSDLIWNEHFDRLPVHYQCCELQLYRSDYSL